LPVVLIPMIVVLPCSSWVVASLVAGRSSLAALGARGQPIPAQDQMSGGSDFAEHPNDPNETDPNFPRSTPSFTLTIPSVGPTKKLRK
jgi:hypothetical protein